MAAELRTTFPVFLAAGMAMWSFSCEWKLCVWFLLQFLIRELLTLTSLLSPFWELVSWSWQQPSFNHAKAYRDWQNNRVTQQESCLTSLGWAMLHGRQIKCCLICSIVFKSLTSVSLHYRNKLKSPVHLSSCFKSSHINCIKSNHVLGGWDSPLVKRPTHS